MNKPTDAFLTTSYTIVDDRHQQYAPALLAGKAGKKPPFCGGEVMTLSIAQHWLGFEGEREYLHLSEQLPAPVPAPDLRGPVQPARGLCWLLDWMRQHLAARMNITRSLRHLIAGGPARTILLSVLLVHLAQMV